MSRILITIDTYATGGAGKTIIQFLKHAGGFGCTPVVAGFWRGSRPEWEFRDAVEAVEGEFFVLRQRWAFDPTPVWRAVALVRSQGITSLQSHGYKSHLVCLLVKLVTGLPWVALVHGWTEENLKVRGYNLLEKLLVRLADRIVPVSRSLEDRLKLGSRQARRCVVIANAADPVPPHPGGSGLRERFGIPSGQVLIGVVGRLSPEKGHRFLIQALPLLAEQLERVTLILVGDGQERRRLTELALSLGLEQKVILAGYQTEVTPFYHACDLIALPSLSEGMPNAALEAMRCSRPVLATRVGGIPEVVLEGETGFLVAPGDPQALADALVRLLADLPRAALMGAFGRRRAESCFDPQERTGKLAALHKELERDAAAGAGRTGKGGDAAAAGREEGGAGDGSPFRKLSAAGRPSRPRH